MLYTKTNIANVYRIFLHFNGKFHKGKHGIYLKYTSMPYKTPSTCYIDELTLIGVEIIRKYLSI